MPPNFKRILKTAQTHLPWSRAIKFGAYNLLTRHLGAHVEPEFRLLAIFNGAEQAIDVGGNWGQSIEAIRRFANPASIFSFEPNPHLAARLDRIHRGDRGIQICSFGLAAEPATQTLYTPIYNDFVFDGASSFDRTEAATFLNPQRMAGFRQKSLWIREERVETRRLDELGLNPSIAKLDVQGYELQALIGGVETFRRCRPFTILENPSSEVVTYFADLGMSPFVLIGDTLFEGRTSGNNTVFMTSEHVERITNDGRFLVRTRVKA
jgi:FkbM family methyltransferase